MIGIGMPIAQARMPFMGGLLWLQERNAEGWGVVPGGGRPSFPRWNGGVNRVQGRKGEVGLWQPRFWEHHIRDRADFNALVQYCWINPVKHGLVERAVDWPYSSIHREIEQGMVEPEWSGSVAEGEFGE